MAIQRRRYTRAQLAIGAIGLSALTAACGAILDVKEPGDNAHIRITGTAVGPIQVIRSNDFKQILDTSSGDITITLVVADTVNIMPPYDENFSLDGRLRFYMRLTNSEATDAELRVRVDIDDVDPYDALVTLGPFPLEYTYSAF